MLTLIMIMNDSINPRHEPHACVLSSAVISYLQS